MAAESIGGMIQFGTVLAHEADHYHTGSSEATAWKRVNEAVTKAALKALQTKIDLCLCGNGLWKITNLRDLYACQCNINPSKKRIE